MNAMAAVQAAMVAALGAGSGISGVVSGVFDGAPARAAFPYIVVGETIGADWSTKTARGRELRMAATIWDEEGRSPRCLDLAEAAQGAIEAMARDLAGWRVASLVFLRSRMLQTPAGPWQALVEYRVRVLAV